MYQSIAIRKILATRASCFSLVELLIVIAILAILMSLLSPSLNSMLHNSRNLACSQNLKSLGIGFSLYTEDHNDIYPYKKQYNGKPDRWGHMMGYNSLVWQNWSVPHIIRPYFGNNIGSEFVCSAYGTDDSNGPATLMGVPGVGLETPVIGNPNNINYLGFDEEGNILHTPNALRWELSLSYLYFGHYEMSGVRGGERVGDRIFFTNTNGGSTPHPTVPSSTLLFSDHTVARVQYHVYNLNGNQHSVWTSHSPPPGSIYQMVRGAGETVAGPEFHYLWGQDFVSNYAFQDGSVRALRSNSIVQERRETFGESYGLLIPLESTD